MHDLTYAKGIFRSLVGSEQSLLWKEHFSNIKGHGATIGFRVPKDKILG